jgi:hypothetical protein
MKSHVYDDYPANCRNGKFQERARWSAGMKREVREDSAFHH